MTEIYTELQRCREAEGCVMDGEVVMKEMREPGMKDRWIFVTLHSCVCLFVCVFAYPLPSSFYRFLCVELIQVYDKNSLLRF